MKDTDLTVYSEPDEGTKSLFTFRQSHTQKKMQKSWKCKNTARGGMHMKKNKITFFAMELILLVLALFFVWKIFIQNVPEKRVAVILPESGDQRWGFSD